MSTTTHPIEDEDSHDRWYSNFAWYRIDGAVNDATRCKHGLTECDKCGTTRRDVSHTTRAGRGAVARLERGR